MSQSAVFVSVNGILYHEIFPSVLNEESLIGICVDLGSIIGSNKILNFV